MIPALQLHFHLLLNMSRYTISGLEHMIRLLAANPALLGLSSLAPLQYIAEKAKAAGKKCGCNVAGIYKENKGAFELALGNLANGDHLVMKKVLGADQLCYYVRNSTG